jgi:hypothetical protein
MSKRFIDRDEIRSILTQDSHYRKNQNWPLLTNENFNLINSHENIDVVDMLNVKLKRDRNSYFHISDFAIRIENKYRFVNDILNKFRGHLVACGGCVINSIISDNYTTHTTHSDLDLFFYDLNIEEANKMRISVICEIINNWRSYSDEVKFIIKRNEFVTSIYVFYYNHLEVEYQLIHRIYPNISSIIGGFDIGACMLAYDGNEIYATPLGAWSLQNRSIIVDTKRRSTSYEHRLVKYFKRGFRIIFPGLDSNITKNKKIIGSAFESEEILKLQIMNLINECGYKIDNIKNIMNECSKIQNIADNNISLQNLTLQNGWYDNIPYLSLTRYNNKLLSQKSLNKISDYHNDTGMEFKHFIPANTTKLRLGNLKAVSSLIIINNFYGNVYDILINDINNPNLQLNEKSIEIYKNKIENIKSFFNRNGNSYSFNDSFYRSMKYFGNFTNEILKIEDVNEYDHYRDIMIKVMIDNAKICEEKLTGIKWITENPGRQWTSSINPIIADPREWYGENYIPVITGIPIDIESSLRLMKLSKTESYWSYLPKEIFDLILFYISKNYADEAWQYI